MQHHMEFSLVISICGHLQHYSTCNMLGCTCSTGNIVSIAHMWYHTDHNGALLTYSKLCAWLLILLGLMENELGILCGLLVTIMVTILETGMCIYKIRYSSIYRVYGIDHASLLSKGEGSTFIYAQSSKLRALWSVWAWDHITMCNAHNFLWSKFHQ